MNMTWASLNAERAFMYTHLLSRFVDGRSFARLMYNSYVHCFKSQYDSYKSYVRRGLINV